MTLSFRRLAIFGIAALALSFVVALVTPGAAEAQDCALCEDCFHCVYDQPFGTEDCEDSGNPECPCEGVGVPCDPTAALGLEPDAHRELLEEDGTVKHLVRLDGEVFGQFSCADGQLIAAFREEHGEINSVSAGDLAALQDRFNLTNYLDVIASMN